jgi:hypothetical protein
MNILFWFGIIFTVIAPFAVKVIFDVQSMVWVTFLIGMFVTFMSKFDKLAEFSLGPLTAKMRDKIKQAEATVDQLQKLALTTTEATLTDLIAGSFMGSMTLKKRIHLRNKLVQTLKDIGVPNDKINGVQSDWRKGISLIYHRNIRWRAACYKDSHQINTDAPEANKKAGEEIEASMDFSEWSAPSPAKIREILNKHKIKIEKVDKWVADYEHFLDCGEINNIDEFVREE